MTLINSVLIQAPVSQRDIQGALGVGSGTNKLSQLCTHSNVNRWAKYKPISYNTSANLTLAQRKSVNYGITNIPVWSGNGAVNKMGNFWFGVNTSSTNYPICGIKTEYWAWQRPTGGASSPYRELDFNGYKHDVSAPVGACTQSTIYIGATGSLTISFSGNGSGQSDGYVVPLSELTGEGVSTGMFGNLYTSAMIRKTGSNIFYVASRDDKWSEDTSTSVTRYVTLTIGNALVGDCEVFPFLSTKKFESFTNDLSGETGPVVAMFEKSSVNVVIKKAKAEPSNFSAWYVNASDKTLHARFTLSNTGDVPFRAKYTVYFSASPTFPDSDTTIGTGEVYIENGSSSSVTKDQVITINKTASYYRNGYARVIVTVAAGYGIIFYESTSAATSIVWNHDPTPTPYD